MSDERMKWSRYTAAENAWVAGVLAERDATRNTVGIPRKLYEKILVAHQDAADALVDSHGDSHRLICDELLALDK